MSEANVLTGLAVATALSGQPHERSELWVGKSLTKLAESGFSLPIFIEQNLFKQAS